MVNRLIVHTVHGTWPNGVWGWRLWKPFRRLLGSRPSWYEPQSDFCEAAGGWAELSSLKKAYQQADENTMLQVVLQGGELRERQT